MHIENFSHRAGIIAEIRPDILRGGFDVIVDIGLIDLWKQLFRCFGSQYHLGFRFSCRRKFGLAASENGFDPLHEIAWMDACTNIVCRIKNDRIGMRRIVNLEFPKQLVLEIKFGFAAGNR